MEIEVITPKFDPKRLAHEAMHKFHRIRGNDARLKYLQVALQRAYEQGVEDGAKDETYFDQ